MDAFAKEMKHVHPAFEILADASHAPIGSKNIPSNMIFDIKPEFTRKARLVAGGHVMAPQKLEILKCSSAR